MSVRIRDMDAADEYFVGACSHLNESPEIDACAERRVAWLKGMHGTGLRVKVASLNQESVGFLYVMPIEVSPWGPLGEDLMVIPCLFVIPRANGKGVGKALLAEAGKEARRQGKKGLAVQAYYHDFWFMPAPFFEQCGFIATRRTGQAAILWEVYDQSAEAPRFLQPVNQFELVPGKVVVDLFLNRFCQTSDIEAHRVREVVGEFGEGVVLREYDASDRDVLCSYQRARGIFVNGREIGWGHEAPREGIREAIAHALSELQSGDKDGV
jgi:GNAT superfamily N-acetyltransferase